MAEPEGVKMWLSCGPGMCDMDVAKTEEGSRIFAGGAEGMIKVREIHDDGRADDGGVWRWPPCPGIRCSSYCAGMCR